MSRTRDHRVWTMMLERRCRVQDFISLKWYCNSILISIRLRVSSCSNRPRNKGLAGWKPRHNPGLLSYFTLDQPFSHESRHCLAWMEKSVAAGARSDNILNPQNHQHCISASMPQSEEIGHFQSTPPLWVSRLQVITVNC